MTDFTTFGKSETDEDGSVAITVFWAGQEMGYIEKETVWGWPNRVDHYTVTLFEDGGMDDGVYEGTFRVEGTFTTARQALADARAFARDTLKTLNRESA